MNLHDIPLPTARTDPPEVDFTRITYADLVRAAAALEQNHVPHGSYIIHPNTWMAQDLDSQAGRLYDAGRRTVTYADWLRRTNGSL